MSEAVKITIDDLTEAAAELRRLHAENDMLLSETRTLVRQNGQWQALNAELVEALTTCVCAMQDYQAGIGITEMFDKGEHMGRAALAKAGVGK